MSPVDSPARLRGADAPAVSGRFWLLAAGAALAIAAVAITVSVLSAVNDNARITRLHHAGIPVSVTVTSCIGNLGGSGSNAANYTCRGSYSVAGSHYVETISSLTTFTSPGRHVAAVVDPAHHGSLTLASALATTQASSARYLIPAAMSLVWLVIAAGYLWWLARRRHAVA